MKGHKIKSQLGSVIITFLPPLTVLYMVLITMPRNVNEYALGGMNESNRGHNWIR